MDEDRYSVQFAKLVAIFKLRKRLVGDEICNFARTQTAIDVAPTLGADDPGTSMTFFQMPTELRETRITELSSQP